MNRRAFLLASAAVTAACTPLVQTAGVPDLTFKGPRIDGDGLISFDGARLGLQTWTPAGEPWAVIVGLHGMNDYSGAFRLAGQAWADQGIATYALDQRGFGRSPPRGIWGGEALMTGDVRALCAVVRARHPNAVVAVAGVSMGGAVAIEAFAEDDAPAADRLVLLSPAVWGWSNQPVANRTLLWLTAHLTRSKVWNPPSWLTRKIHATDNIEELIRMGRDPQMTWGARSDALYGLVDLMEAAWRDIGAVQAKVPSAYFYGARDQIITAEPARQAAAKLAAAGGRTAYYPDGWHLLLVDRQRGRVIDDVAAFLRDPAAPFPSQAASIPPPKRDVT